MSDVRKCCCKHVLCYLFNVWLFSAGSYRTVLSVSIISSYAIVFNSCISLGSERRNRTMSPIKPNPAKVFLRDQIAAKIAALTNEEKKRQSQIVYDKIINHPWYKSSSRVALFMSTEHEIDTAPLISHIKARGAAAFVPQYAGGVMRMLQLESGDEANMKLTKHGIAQHSKDQVRENAVDSGGLDLIIAPGVAFTRAGARLGHGGGYYDKFITNLRSNPVTAPKIVAVAFNCQITDEVPMDEHDQKVDAVVFAE